MQRFYSLILIFAVVVFVILIMSSFSGCGVIGYGGHYIGRPLFYSGPPVYYPLSPRSRGYGYWRRSIREGSRGGPGFRGGGLRGGK